mmetsp:Transcript_7348/g.9500  ORF Transcript_7348/g.9500 Transcript_7348/m.9500 type:complete len:874 (-) Transcript_7348:114-2735(-)
MKSRNTVKRRQARAEGIFGKRKTSPLVVALIIFVSVCNIGTVLYKNLNKEHWVLVFVNDKLLHLNQSMNEGKNMMQNSPYDHDEKLNETIIEEHLHRNQSMNEGKNMMQNLSNNHDEKLNQTIGEEYLHLNQPINEGGNVMQNVPYDHNVCPSPERDIPWIFDGTCEERPLLSTFSSLEVTRSCGFCGDDTAYLRELRDDISAKYKDRCKDLVVYGAAIGEQYEEWVGSTSYLSKHTSEVVKRHDTCFFLFVTDTKNTGKSFAAHGSQMLIVVDPARMPFENNRRNTKVLKLNPGLIFPWAERVIWQDTKLQFRDIKYSLPSDYMLHFNRTVERFGVCSSFVGMPLHRNTAGASPDVNLQAHCNAIIAASERRPTVSDSLQAVRAQCEASQKLLSERIIQDNSRSKEFYQEPLVDTAFIVYDMRTPDCRQFNGNLGCSWLDEIHCYSDRDQISFPVVVANSGLRLSPTLHTPGYELRDRVYVNMDDIPMLHVAKRSCHWYYHSFSRCVAPDVEDIYEANNYLPNRNEESRLKVAVIVAGTLQRFMITSTIKHLIEPMSYKTKVADVDYYASLTTAKAMAYGSDTSYTDRLQPDPKLPVSTLHDSVDIEDYIRSEFGPIEARIGALQIQESIDIDAEPMLKARRKKALIENPSEDPDQRFPIIDNRTADKAKRTANANRNLLRMHLAIQNLWSKALKWEAEEGFKYDYVLFLRDDSLWLNDFDILKITEKEGDIFVPSCDARDPPLHPLELNDHILISTRKTAGIFGNYYSALFQTDVEGCMKTLPTTLNRSGERGCNSEMLLKWIVDEKNVTVTKVSQSEVPFQRSANVRLSDGSIMQCFHKFCQSKHLPLQFNNDMQVCSKIDWDKISSSRT